MASVPLHCNICPKHPDFSDISHLLTHVGSKGHLSHYFKAQVRSRQESAVRHQLDIYDRWYAQYQIERLLSQRMQLKETKDSLNKPRATRKTAPGIAGFENAPTKARRVRNILQPPEVAKVEEVIDPQLCQIQPPSMGSSIAMLPSPIRDTEASEIASKHRAHVPRMQRQQTADPPRTVSSEATIDGAVGSLGKIAALDTESDSDYEGTPSQTPVRMTYPDPTPQAGYARIHSPREISSDIEAKSKEADSKVGLDDNHSVTDDAPLAQSPTLKGVQWPGMNIFDSASPEAQRKRNQKKNRSIMAQMELNSTIVEPLERIYWPEGGLKKERVITGNVESSPIQEVTPKPKRRRGPTNRPVLGDLSVNEPRRGRKPRAAKPIPQNQASGEDDLGHLSQRGPAVEDCRGSVDLRRAHSRLDAIDEENFDWAINVGDYDVTRNRDFPIFDDEMEDERKRQASHCYGPTHDFLFPHSTRNDPAAASSQSLGRNHGLPPNGSQPESYSYMAHDKSSSMPREPNGRTHRPFRPASSNSANKENLYLAFDDEGPLENESRQAIPERITQRYFSLAEAHPPQFYDYLPPQMEFGGMADPMFLGASPNPLNPRARMQHNQLFQRQDRCITPATAHMMRANRKRKPSGTFISDAT